MQAVDLHVHSNRSDGTFTPAQLVDYAAEKGLAAFALTDHDTTDGIEEAILYAEKRKKMKFPGKHPESIPEVIPGIELSTEYQGRDIHIIGLYINYRDPALMQHLRAFVESRDIRNHKMCRLLTQTGIPVTYDTLQKEFPDAVITRAHYAKYLLNHGYTKTMKEGFDRYVGEQCPCYVPREKVTPAQAVRLILQAEGIPVLAHPILYHMSPGQLEQLIVTLKEAGLMGIEAVYSTYTEAEERLIRTLAAKHRLLVSGGSDFHGANKPGLDLGTGYGKLFVPCSLLADIKSCLRPSSPSGLVP